MSRQNSIQISKPRSLAFKIETDLTVVPISEYDDPELKRRKESLNRRVHQISRVGKAIRTEGWAAGTTARWITGITKGLDAIEIMVKWFVRGPFEDQLSVIFLVERAIDLLVEMLDAVEKNQASPCEELLNEIVNYKDKIHTALKPVFDLAQQDFRFKMCLHPRSLRNAIMEANRSLDSLSTLYQLTIAGQMRFTVAQNHQAIQDLTAAMEKHSIELVEYISQDEEGMKVWMKDMGRDVESLRVDMADLPKSIVEELRRTSILFPIRAGYIASSSGSDASLATTIPGIGTPTYGLEPGFSHSSMATHILTSTLLKLKGLVKGNYKSKHDLRGQHCLSGMSEDMTTEPGENESAVTEAQDDVQKPQEVEAEEPILDPAFTQFWESVELASNESLNRQEDAVQWGTPGHRK